MNTKNNSTGKTLMYVERKKRVKREKHYKKFSKGNSIRGKKMKSVRWEQIIHREKC